MRALKDGTPRIITPLIIPVIALSSRIAGKQTQTDRIEEKTPTGGSGGGNGWSTSSIGSSTCTPPLKVLSTDTIAVMPANSAHKSDEYASTFIRPLVGNGIKNAIKMNKYINILRYFLGESGFQNAMKILMQAKDEYIKAEGKLAQNPKYIDIRSEAEKLPFLESFRLLPNFTSKFGGIYDASVWLGFSTGEVHINRDQALGEIKYKSETGIFTLTYKVGGESREKELGRVIN